MNRRDATTDQRMFTRLQNVFTERLSPKKNWSSMKISYRDHVTNEAVLERVDQERKLLPTVKSRKLEYFGHISRHTSCTRERHHAGHYARPQETGRSTERMVR